MEDALKELGQAEREGAREAQEEAIQKLAEAKEKLEEILRQLREEEAELMLRALEVRFQKMLAMQQAVLTDTLALAAVDPVTDREIAEARALSRQERAIGLEGAKALQLLREDGSSVAFPGGVGADRRRRGVRRRPARPHPRRRTDPSRSSGTLSSRWRNSSTRSSRSSRSSRQEQSQSQPQEGMQPGEEALIDKISELKMLRTLQKGVNRRTRLLGLEVPAPGEAADLDVTARLRDLSGRQSRIESATYDLAVGKTN